jgi:peptidyl-prolyl cis-trans isomerase SurA
MKRVALFLSILFISVGLAAQTQSQGQTQKPPVAPAQGKTQTAAPAKTPAPSKAPAPPRVHGQSQVIEEIVARVNNEIITTSELERSRLQLQEEIRQDCAKCPPEELAAKSAEKVKDLLRDLIDQALLAQRGKDMGINVETQVIKQLDVVRLQNGLESMEDLQKKVEEQGGGFEDFKNSIRNNLLTQEVIRREVQGDILIDRSEAQKYYDAHKDEFKRPDMVYLREIFVSTDKKTDEERPKLQEKAKSLLDRVKKGEDFGELAKHFSDGQTAKQGGELGGFERGQLDPKIEPIVFKLNRNDMTDVIETKNGFMILQVEMRYEAGLQPIDKVEGEIMNRLYMEKTGPALRVYLKKLREESFLYIKPGFVDSAAVAANTSIEEVPASADDPKGNKGKKRSIIPFKGKGKKSGT